MPAEISLLPWYTVHCPKIIIEGHLQDRRAAKSTLCYSSASPFQGTQQAACVDCRWYTLAAHRSSMCPSSTALNTTNKMYDGLPRPTFMRHALPCALEALASTDLLQSLLLVITPSCSCCHSGPELLNWSVEAQLPNSLLDLLHLPGRARAQPTLR